MARRKIGTKRAKSRQETAPVPRSPSPEPVPRRSRRQREEAPSPVPSPTPPVSKRAVKRTRSGQDDPPPAARLTRAVKRSAPVDASQGGSSRPAKRRAVEAAVAPLVTAPPIVLSQNPDRVPAPARIPSTGPVIFNAPSTLWSVGLRSPASGVEDGSSASSSSSSDESEESDELSSPVPPTPVRGSGRARRGRTRTRAATRGERRRAPSLPPPEANLPSALPASLPPPSNVGDFAPWYPVPTLEGRLEASPPRPGVVPQFRTRHLGERATKVLAPRGPGELRLTHGSTGSPLDFAGLAQLYRVPKMRVGPDPFVALYQLCHLSMRIQALNAQHGAVHLAHRSLDYSLTHYLLQLKNFSRDFLLMVEDHGAASLVEMGLGSSETDVDLFATMLRAVNMGHSEASLAGRLASAQQVHSDIMGFLYGPRTDASGTPLDVVPLPAIVSAVGDSLPLAEPALFPEALSPSTLAALVGGPGDAPAVLSAVAGSGLAVSSTQAPPVPSLPPITVLDSGPGPSPPVATGGVIVHAAVGPQHSPRARLYTWRQTMPLPRLPHRSFRYKRVRVQPWESPQPSQDFVLYTTHSYPKSHTMSNAEIDFSAFDAVSKDAHDAIKGHTDGNIPLSLLVSATERLMSHLDKSVSASANDDNIQRMFRARNCLNNFRNNCDNSYVQPEVHATVTRFCALIQQARANEAKKATGVSSGKGGSPSTTASSSKRPASSSLARKSGKKKKSAPTVETSDEEAPPADGSTPSQAMVVDDQGSIGPPSGPEGSNTAEAVSSAINRSVTFEIPQAPSTPPPRPETLLTSALGSGPTLPASNMVIGGSVPILPVPGLQEMHSAAYLLHQQHTSACHNWVVQQQLLAQDAALMNCIRELEHQVRQYHFLAGEQNRLLQVLQATPAQ
ncbi:hypothetical protein P691DRAFT_780778 [Macrolepiota fuliginosa MF-IS2]|uniref:Uncharacterized protein n=1 Tax=Macrolepiota fuliginosa MF-IS2 TaxID=1400762 RepID=A0A9P6BV03_9AGAR|nr:hypothetical protein P691DRAFT_780778 [Macrolepiota fuliginosa MF-IS2]